MIKYQFYNYFICRYLFCLLVCVSLTNCFEIPPPYTSNVGQPNEAPIIRVTHEYDHIEGSVTHINDIIIYDSDAIQSPEALVQLSLLPSIFIIYLFQF